MKIVRKLNGRDSQTGYREFGISQNEPVDFDVYPIMDTSHCVRGMKSTERTRGYLPVVEMECRWDRPGRFVIRENHYVVERFNVAAHKATQVSPYCYAQSFMVTGVAPDCAVRLPGELAKEKKYMLEVPEYQEVSENFDPYNYSHVELPDIELSKNAKPLDDESALLAAQIWRALTYRTAQDREYMQLYDRLMYPVTLVLQRREGENNDNYFKRILTEVSSRLADILPDGAKRIMSVAYGVPGGTNAFDGTAVNVMIDDESTVERTKTDCWWLTSTGVERRGCDEALDERLKHIAEHIKAHTSPKLFDAIVEAHKDIDDKLACDCDLFSLCCEIELQNETSVEALNRHMDYFIRLSKYLEKLGGDKSTMDMVLNEEELRFTKLAAQNTEWFTRLAKGSTEWEQEVYKSMLKRCVGLSEGDLLKGYRNILASVMERAGKVYVFVARGILENPAICDKRIADVATNIITSEIFDGKCGDETTNKTLHKLLEYEIRPVVESAQCRLKDQVDKKDKLTYEEFGNFMDLLVGYEKLDANDVRELYLAVLGKVKEKGNANAFPIESAIGLIKRYDDKQELYDRYLEKFVAIQPEVKDAIEAIGHSIKDVCPNHGLSTKPALEIVKTMLETGHLPDGRKVVPKTEHIGKELLRFFHLQLEEGQDEGTADTALIRFLSDAKADAFDELLKAAVSRQLEQGKLEELRKIDGKRLKDSIRYKLRAAFEAKMKSETSWDKIVEIPKDDAWLDDAAFEYAYPNAGDMAEKLRLEALCVNVGSIDELIHYAAALEKPEHYKSLAEKLCAELRKYEPDADELLNGDYTTKIIKKVLGKIKDAQIADDLRNRWIGIVDSHEYDVERMLGAKANIGRVIAFSKELNDNESGNYKFTTNLKAKFEKLRFDVPALLGDKPTYADIARTIGRLRAEAGNENLANNVQKAICEWLSEKANACSVFVNSMRKAERIMDAVAISGKQRTENPPADRKGKNKRGVGLEKPSVVTCPVDATALGDEYNDAKKLCEKLKALVEASEKPKADDIDFIRKYAEMIGGSGLTEKQEVKAAAEKDIVVYLLTHIKATGALPFEECLTDFTKGNEPEDRCLTIMHVWRTLSENEECAKLLEEYNDYVRDNEQVSLISALIRPALKDNHNKLPDWLNDRH